MPETAVHVTYSVECRRRIVDRCLERAARDDVRGISGAEAAFRADGWKLHTDGSASCPVCLKAWEIGSPDELAVLEITPTPPDAKGDPEIRTFDEASDAALDLEVNGDGGLGAELARKADR